MLYRIYKGESLYIRYNTDAKIKVKKIKVKVYAEKIKVKVYVNQHESQAAQSYPVLLIDYVISLYK